jgi:hypothetical protein
MTSSSMPSTAWVPPTASVQPTASTSTTVIARRPITDSAGVEGMPWRR